MNTHGVIYPPILFAFAFFMFIIIKAVVYVVTINRHKYAILKFNFV